MASFVIRGLAIAQADRKITSAQLDEELGLKSGYIAKRSGVQHRFTSTLKPVNLNLPPQRSNKHSNKHTYVNLI